MKKQDKIWLDGKFVDWDQAQVHILTHTLHYGFGVFEGTRCYKCVDGSAIFRLDEHLQRLYNSAQILTLEIPYAQEDLEAASCEILRVNKMEEGYLRHIVFIGEGEMGLGTMTNPIRTAIIAWAWGAYLGEEGLKKGIRLKTSSYARLPVQVFPTKAKAVGNYVNSILAKREALKAGYDEALMLDLSGYVAECSGENIFLVNNQTIRTTPESSSILNGITRKSVIQLARDQGYTVLETTFPRDEVYTADEVFLTGTAAEVTPVREVDNRQIGAGKAGPATLALQAAFFDVVKGKNKKYKQWLTYL
ncbi:MAG: branched chain amino acid aminotransferase [Deltaproteobacteria bacterium RBG_13_61_14]|nr:MAG: branched chain amino acid aminotransferase [Deltaproteobacteria bacterium RBG_13_61_14]